MALGIVGTTIWVFHGVSVNGDTGIPLNHPF